MGQAVAMLVLAAAVPLPARPAAPLSNPTPPADAAIALLGPVRPGGLLHVSLPDGASGLLVNGEALAPAPDGRFLIAIGRDQSGPLILDVLAPPGPLASLRLEVPERRYAMQALPALGTSADPAPAWKARRATEEAAISAALEVALAAPAEASGYVQHFRRPVEGRQTASFGVGRSFGGVPQPPHRGIDIAARRGTPVLAPADGVVRLAEGPFLIEGRMILLDHGAGLVSGLMHLDTLAAEPGQKVRQGDAIGTVGSTGRSTGPHLHWEVLRLLPADGWCEGDEDGAVRAVPVDPALLLQPLTVAPMQHVPTTSRRG